MSSNELEDRYENGPVCDGGQLEATLAELGGARRSSAAQHHGDRQKKEDS